MSRGLSKDNCSLNRFVLVNVISTSFDNFFFCSRCTKALHSFIVLLLTAKLMIFWLADLTLYRACSVGRRSLVDWEYRSVNCGESASFVMLKKVSIVFVYGICSVRICLVKEHISKTIPFLL